MATRTFLNSLVGDVDGVSQFVMQEEANCTMDLDNNMGPCVQPQNVNDFKSLSENVSRNVIFKRDKATTDMQEAMKVESTMINGSVKENLGLSPNDDVSTEHIFDYYFGETSKFASLFIQHMGKDYHYFLKFLNTTFILQAYRLSISMLYDRSSLINKTILKVSIVIMITNHNFYINFFSPSILSPILSE